MPPATAYGDHSWPDDHAFVRVLAFDCLGIPVTDLQRSIVFYSDLFAMRVVAGGIDAGRVVLSRGGRIRLALYANGSPTSDMRVTGFVESLESAREVVWNLGIATVRDIVETAGADAPRDNDSFAIRDPDGHEIRFVEDSRDENTGIPQ